MRPLLLCALALVSCQRAQIHQVLPADVRIDVFPQLSQPKLDALFVVDNSRYMGVHQKRVADSFHRFVDYLDRNEMDWHLGLVNADVNADPGVYQGGGDKNYFSSTDDNVAQAVSQAVIALGTAGNAISPVLQQADLALHGPPDGFLRDGAALFVVAVTDNGDQWSPPGDVQPYEESNLYYFRALKQSRGAGNDGLVRFSALAGPSPGGCTIPDPSNPANTFVAQPAPRLIDMAQRTGGGFESLCAPDFDAVFDELGATSAGFKRNFRLAKVPNLATLQVTVRAPCDVKDAALAACASVSDECGETPPARVCTPKEQAQDGWIFDAPTNSLVFTGAAIPPRSSQVLAEYKEAGK